MSKKKTHEQYVEELKYTNPNIEVIDTYIDCKTPILHRCSIHNIEWRINPNNALKGKSCFLCKGDKIKYKKRMSDEEYIARLSVLNKNVTLIGEYINANTPVVHRCNIHGIEWSVRPADALKGSGCKKCHLERFAASKSKTHEEYVNELKNFNMNIEVIGAYVKAKMPITHRCKICGHKWDASPDNILQGTGCPQCNASRGEREISMWLSNNLIVFEPQKTFDGCRNKKLLPFDFYLPEYNICIEYDGEQHFKPITHFGGQEKFEQRKDADKIKTQYCKNSNIKLIRIPYNDYNNLNDTLRKNILNPEIQKTIKEIETTVYPTLLYTTSSGMFRFSINTLQPNTSASFFSSDSK